MGYNMAALRVLGMQMRETNTKDYIDDDMEEDESRTVRKRGFVHVS